MACFVRRLIIFLGDFATPGPGWLQPCIGLAKKEGNALSETHIHGLFAAT